jgi:hypothetical protein
MKTCSKCNEKKEYSEFYKQGKYLSSKCKPCIKEYMKEYCKTDAYKEYLKTDAYKKYRQSDAFKESQKKYYQSDACKELQKIYHKADAYKENQKKCMKKYMNTELYFKNRLNKKGFKDNEITPELIELQKLSIVTYRYTQQLNQVKQ